MRVPAQLKSLASVFKSNGFQCFLVGGAVRDMLLGREVSDYDIATNAMPADVSKMFRRVIPTGAKHGTVTVLFKGSRFEATTFRIEGKYSDGRRPDWVAFSPSIYDDLSRRDFTMNAIAFDLESGGTLDPHGGIEDMRKGLVRAIGDPDERFHEDGLRPVRACRFAAQFAFVLERETREAIGRALNLVSRVSAERIRDELIKMLSSEKPSIGLELMRETGILAIVLPELDACAGIEQRELHCFDVFHHSLYSCDAAPRESLVLRLAALLHDIGKPEALKTLPDGVPTFHRHEEASARLSRILLRRLRFPVALMKRVSHLISHHMFNYQEEWSNAAVRRFIARVGSENIQELLVLRRADQVGMCRQDNYPQRLIEFSKRIERIIQGEKALTLKDLAVNGKDIMEELSILAGPQVGVILDFLLQSVLDDPELNTRERLLEIARNFRNQRLGGSWPPSPPA